MIEITCSECGATLSIYKVNQFGTSVTIEVDPCEICQAASDDEGYARCKEDFNLED